MKQSTPSAIIIGGGFTGCALAYDLARRGFRVDVLERGELTSGTSGRTHGLLHSGGRYCVSDPEAAVECIQENIILRKIAKQCIEFNGGYFVALDEEDLEYAPLFVTGAQACGIPTDEIDVTSLLQLEPALSPRVLKAYIVPDGTFDPLRLGFSFAASAKMFGAVFHTFTGVSEFIQDGKGSVTGVRAIDRHANHSLEFKADITINATGVWAGKITQMVQVEVPVIPTPGVMVAFEKRVAQHVINRLCEPSDGDILLPQRRMSIIGTTSFEVEDADYIPVEVEQIKLMQERASRLVPELNHTKIRGAYISARPLIGSLMSGRSLSRTFKCYDHEAIHGIGGFVTVTGGKATTCRLMAEKTADLVCQKLGWLHPCETHLHLLTDYHQYFHQDVVQL